MSLETGRYIIKNGDKIVGRALAEDLSLNPKRIILASNDNESTWIIEKTNSVKDQSYLFISFGSPTTHIEHNVFALLVNQEAATKWIVIPVSQHDKDAYLITTADRNGGWVAPKEIGEQIQYRPLIVAPSEPPQYPTSEVFHITKVKD
ncbi:serine protease inhibitor [Lentinula aff. lateritia]|uniref:Serine protease inhibitor n=1 Tax=Lentinula aff. lateritia TaxID=2804960 RepID=A0ACC1TK17_9AGAR|nr:serine protease inhibitor [Lentinula aff. lateritia]